jgi:non-specific serine/threonine protein kinase
VGCVRKGEHERAAKLLRVAKAAFAITGASFFPSLEGRDSRCRAQIQASPGAPAFAAAVDGGARMSVDESMSLALDAEGARSRRKAATDHSAAGGLTRREVEVTGLVAEGLSNNAIASRLVISQRSM